MSYLNSDTWYWTQLTCLHVYSKYILHNDWSLEAVAKLHCRLYAHCFYLFSHIHAFFLSLACQVKYRHESHNNNKWDCCTSMIITCWTTFTRSVTKFILWSTSTWLVRMRESFQYCFDQHTSSWPSDKTSCSRNCPDTKHETTSHV